MLETSQQFFVTAKNIELMPTINKKIVHTIMNHAGEVSMIRSCEHLGYNITKISDIPCNSCQYAKA